MPNVQPNSYELVSTDGQTKVTYETSTLIGQPTLSLTQGASPARVFTGSQIRTLSTEIGTLVTVTSLMTIDTGSQSFSVLIPAIGLSNANKPAEFSTDAILTSHTGPDSFPRSGVYERYEFIAMHGVASVVISLFEPVREILSKTAHARQ